MDPGEVRELLDDRPALEAALTEVRSIDDSAGSWDFDDVAVDSGAFGELVNAGIVESVADGYRLADPRAVDQALAADSVHDLETDARRPTATDWTPGTLPNVDRVAVAVLTGLLGITIGFRASTYPAVFRDRVVYPGNDPYAYVYYVETGLRNGWALSNIPAGQADQVPFTMAILLWMAELAGGVGSHALVLTWAPVLAAVATAIALYLFVGEVTEDRRVALAAVLVLALLPVHVMRTSLGFVDHHAFDYFWLTLTAWGAVTTLDLESLGADWRTIRAVALLAIGIAGSVLSWWAATVLLFPIAIAIVVGGAIAVRDDDSFLAPGLATAAGAGAAAVVVSLTHLAWGWHRPVVVGVPAVLTIGILGVVAATSVWRRLEVPPWTFPATGVAGIAATAIGVYGLAPDAWQTVREGVRWFVGYENIVEFQSLFGTSTMGWLFSFGLLLFVILPAMGWGLYRAASGDRRWLVASSYAWFMLALMVVAARWAGEFAPFAALFAGLGIVGLAERVDAAGPPVPFGGEERPLSVPAPDVAFRLAVVVLLVCGLAAVLAPIGAHNVTIPEEQYQAAAYIDDHATAAGYEYPESYVFSPWTWSRMYNYHVNGEAGGYTYADNNYRPFTLSEDPEDAYTRHIAGGQAESAYLVTEPVPGDPDLEPATMQSRLHERYGSRGEGVAGLAYYRALYASSSGEYKVFRVVEGATIRGETDAGGTVTVETSVEIEGDSFAYTRQTTADGDGEFAVTVPYPGTYTLDGAASDEVTVDESAVQTGADVHPA